MVISAVLARIVDDEGLPLFLLKGGVAMELRVGLQARTSKDYDTAFRQVQVADKRLRVRFQRARQPDIGDLVAFDIFDI